MQDLFHPLCEKRVMNALCKLNCSSDYFDFRIKLESSAQMWYKINWLRVILYIIERCDISR